MIIYVGDGDGNIILCVHIDNEPKPLPSKHKPSHNSRSYSSYTTSSSKATTTTTPGLADEVIHSFLATNADDVDLIHEDLDQIDDMDLEEMDNCYELGDAMTAKKINIHSLPRKTGRRPKSDGKMHVAFFDKRIEAGRGQDFKPVRTEKEALMTIDEGQINWVEQTADEELNHALMAFTVNNEVSMCSKLCLDSYNALQAKYDELQSEFGDQEAALTAHKLAVKKLESQLRASHKQQSSLTEKLNFQANQIFEKDEKLKKYRRIGMKAVKDHKMLYKKLVNSGFASLKSYGSYLIVDELNFKNVNDDPIHDHIPIPSIEQVTIATQKTQPQVPKPQQTVDPSCAQHVKTPRQPIRTPVTPSPIPSYNRQNWNQRMERDLGAGYSFERKPCFVCGSLSHLIKNCDYYEKKMAREAALKSKRVVHADDRQATPAWTNTNRVNKANQFTPRPVQLSNIKPNLSTASKTIKTGRVNVNTGHGNVNSGSMHVNSGTQIKSGASRFNTGKQHVNSGSVHVNSARVNRPVSNNTSPNPSQVNLQSPKKCFSKQRSPVNRLFSRNTAHKSNKYAVKGQMGTAVKTSAGCVWRQDHPLKHMEHRGIFDSGCSGHMTGNRAHLENIVNRLNTVSIKVKSVSYS
ncbi:hypothetical protein Tco_1313261 [Tanacetum coccineum]